MKRYLLAISICLIATLSCLAQEGHMKFMGIELNGTISEFQTKLQSKEFVVSKQSSQYPNGMRAYDGVFSGENAQIIVWYNPRSKQVYRAKAVIERYGKDLVKQLMDKMKAKLDLKYGSECRYSEVVKDDHLQEFEQSSWEINNGTIDLFVVSTGYSAQNTFFLQVDYRDKENYLKNTMDEMDDL